MVRIVAVHETLTRAASREFEPNRLVGLVYAPTQHKHETDTRSPEREKIDIACTYIARGPRRTKVLSPDDRYVTRKQGEGRSGTRREREDRSPRLLLLLSIVELRWTDTRSARLESETRQKL